MNLSAAWLDLPLARAVLDLPDDRLTCHDCQAGLPTYIEAEVGDMAWRDEYRPVKRHLLLCRECSTIYLDVLQIALFEHRGQLPRPDWFPRPDLNFLPGEHHDD